MNDRNENNATPQGPESKMYPLAEFSPDAKVMIHGQDVTHKAVAIVTSTPTTEQVTIMVKLA